MLLIAPWCVALFVLCLIQKIKYEDEVVISAIFLNQPPIVHEISCK